MQFDADIKRGGDRGSPDPPGLGLDPVLGAGVGLHLDGSQVT